jgi:hypothetical protein
LPTIGKVYDKILATRLSYHLEVRGVLSDNQFRFSKGRGTTEAIDRAVGEDDRHLRFSQIWPGQIRADRGTLVRKNPKLRKSVKYLGVIIDRGLLWIEHTRYVAGKVMVAAHKVHGLAGKT